MILVKTTKVSHNRHVEQSEAFHGTFKNERDSSLRSE